MLKVNQQNKPRDRAHDYRSHTALSKTKHMKKLTLLLILLTIRFNASAQVPTPNPGFELQSVDSTPLYWGALTLFAIQIDSNGNSLDSLVFDGKLYGTTTDAHTGNYALELRNAYDFYAQIGYEGKAFAMQDSSQFYSPSLDFTNLGNPDVVSFFYKYSPMGNDSAYVRVKVYDEFFSEIASSDISLGGLVSTYTQVNLPVVYYQTGSATIVELGFFNSTPSGTTTLGTRMQVDDVSITTTTGISYAVGEENIKVSPTPANTLMHLTSSQKIDKINVFDINGKLTQSIKGDQKTIDCSVWPEGMYLLKISSGNKIFSQKTIIKH